MLLAVGPTPVGAPGVLAAAVGAGLLAGLAEVLDLLRAEPLAGALRLGQRAARAGRDVEAGVDVIAGGVRLDGVLEGELEGPVDHLPAGDVLPVDERDGHTRRPGPASTADAVQVGLLVVGALVVDDVRDVVDVDAARGDVGGHEDIDLAGAEGAQGLLTGSLAEVAVDGADREPPLGELVACLLGAALRAGEHHDELAVLGLQDAGQQLDLVHGVHAPHVLLDGIDGGVLVAGVGRAQVRGLGHVAAREVDDGARHGGREEHRLALGRDHRDDALDVGEEPHVEHLVGLVENEDANVRQVEVAAIGEVDDPARGADDDLDALDEGVDLGLVGAAAVDRQDADALDATGALDVGGDLQAELARRADHEGLGLALRLGGQCVVLVGPPDGDALEQRDAEAEGLAGAGFGLADEVAALQREGDALLLDGEGMGDAVGREGLGDLRIGAQFDERGGGCGVHSAGLREAVVGFVQCCVAQGNSCYSIITLVMLAQLYRLGPTTLASP